MIEVGSVGHHQIKVFEFLYIHVNRRHTQVAEGPVGKRLGYLYLAHKREIYRVGRRTSLCYVYVK